MRLFINGENHVMPGGLTLSMLLERLDFGQRRVVVELNSRVIPRAEHADVCLAENDRVEIVHAIGGG